MSEYYWVLGYSELGKRALVGPYTSEVKAMEAADCLTDSDIYPLDTKNQQKAAKIIKAKIMEESKEPDDALQRQLHDRGLKREGVKFASPTQALALGGDDIFKGDPFKD